MLAGGCAARRSALPAVCLHFPLFNGGSLVCEAQLHGLIVNQSIPCEHAWPNACRLVIFLPQVPQGGKGTRKRSNCRTYASHQSRWQMEEPRRRSQPERRLPSSNSPSLKTLVSDLFHDDCLGCILAQAGILLAVCLESFLCVLFLMILLNAHAISACNRDNNREWVIQRAIRSIAGPLIKINVMTADYSHCFHNSLSVPMTFSRFLREYCGRFHFRRDTVELFIPEGYRYCWPVGVVLGKSMACNLLVQGAGARVETGTT